MRTVVPQLIRRRSTDEYRPPPPRPNEMRAAARAASGVAERSAEQRLHPLLFAETRTATAVGLRAIDAEAGGGFFSVPVDAERSSEVADETFGDPSGPPVIDVQTHLVNPAHFTGPSAEALTWYLQMADGDRWAAGVDGRDLAPAVWARTVFGASETALALITAPPGADHTRVIDNDEIAQCRAIVDHHASPGRVLTHAIVHPNVAGDLEAMPDWATRCRPSGWKVYPLYGPRPGDHTETGWFLDDETGTRFLEQVRSVGPTRVAVHKGISGAIHDASPLGASPRDVGPAAARFPDIDFLVYHSGYEPNLDEAAFRPDGHGVDQLIASCAAHDIGVGGNVYAELGSTWHLVLRRPEQAAHVLGKLLNQFGPEQILWGTDSVWYGSPQPLIDAFRAFTIPAWMQERFGYPELTATIKRQILGRNAQRVYGSEAAPRSDDWVEAAAEQLDATFPQL
ncbi:MAG: amidohydrolase family protein [Acidimicrobiales bacterium]